MSINKDLSKTSQVQGFTEVVDIIVRHRSKASRAVNEQSLLCAWNVGGYVSKKLKSEEWGSKVVTNCLSIFAQNILILRGLVREIFITWLCFMMNILQKHLLQL